MSQATRIGATLGASLILALSACTDAQADTLGVHAVSWHDREGYNNINPGLMYRHGATGLTVGATAGVLTGYSRASATPFVIPSVRIGDHVRVLYAPAADPKGATVVSLVLETEF